MKKILLLLMVAIAVISCEGPMGPQGPMGPTGPGTDWNIQDFEVKTGDWVYKSDGGLNGYYSYSFSYPKLDNFIYNNGIVLVYLESDGTYQQMLPVVFHQENGIDPPWTTTTDFDYEIGKITFYVTNSDFYNQRPETMLFRTVLMW
jgi:hypothetical protein